VLTTILCLIVAVLAVGEFLLFGALAEAYRSIRYLSDHPSSGGRYVPVDLGSVLGAVPSAVGMHPTLDSAVSAYVVYVANHCGACRSIIDSLSGGLPPGVWLAVIAKSTDEAFDWLQDGGIQRDTPAAQRVMVVSAEATQETFGTNITPLAIEIEHGHLVRAKTVGTAKQFYSLVPSTLTLSKPMQEGVSA
jgi:hypothetical protein